ncbi:MAG: BREX-1 system adenine-specific DNA-methyltransferase PglX, partial [Thalassotalea sp.]|nr:BREX-1 system adenine-specific DNA-methyltransferase PglX [Thalassotalea sp.]
LFSTFIIRNLAFVRQHGELGFMTPFVWMFISSYEKLRNNLINEQIISSLIQLEYSGFDGATVPICTFTLTKGNIENYIGSYIKLSDFKGAENQSPKVKEAIQNKDCNWFFYAQQNNFKKMPGSPIAYWISENMQNAFDTDAVLGGISEGAVGLQTGDNNRFLRLWHEVQFDNIGLNYDNREQTKESHCKWFPYNKGGSYRKWYGNQEHVVNWALDGKEVIEFQKYLNSIKPASSKMGIANNSQYYFRPSVSWSFISSSYFGVRVYPKGFIFDVSGSSVFSSEDEMNSIAGFLCSNLAPNMMKNLNPTLNFQVGNVIQLPYLSIKNDSVQELIDLSRDDWNSFETSWDFRRNPLMNIVHEQNKLDLRQSYQLLLKKYNEVILTTQKLEEENNSLYIDAFELHSDLSTHVPLEQVTLKINPKYRYDKLDSNTEYLSRFQLDTIFELLSFSLGCMMGRYSLDHEGLVYANSHNDGFKELESEGTYKSFPADDDGIVPLASDDWLFGDDATVRFREFVKTVWGEENLQENIEFVAESLCLHALKPVKGESANDTVRRYFSKQFYKEHCKTYKKRPIYWLFSSGKEKAFECLVYLHRYNEGTLSRMRTEYVTPLMGKYEAQHSLLAEQKVEATTTEARRIEKELKSLEKKQAELRTFDEQLKHYAEMRITLNLDDGVKANYGKFGNLLADVKAIHGKAVK